jgi:predicted transcriptional regulator
MAKGPPFSIRLEDELRARAEKAAEKQRRSLANVIALALEEWLDRQEGKRK